MTTRKQAWRPETMTKTTLDRQGKHEYQIEKKNYNNMCKEKYKKISNKK